MCSHATTSQTKVKKLMSANDTKTDEQSVFEEIPTMHAFVTLKRIL